MLAETAEVPFIETFDFPDSSATYVAANGVRSAGRASVHGTLDSITVSFADLGGASVERPDYGTTSGKIEATKWAAAEVTYAGTTESRHRFDCSAFHVGRANGAGPAATRYVFAGAGWSADATIDGRPVLVRDLSGGAANHHDRRLSLTVGGAISPARAEAIERVLAFISGLDLQLLCTESYDASGRRTAVDHTRGFKRVGRAPHSPFERIGSDERGRIFETLTNASLELAKSGFPIDMLLEQIASSNTVHQIHLGAVFLMIAVQTAAHHSSGGDYAAFSRDLGLGLSEGDLRRLSGLHDELLGSGFFHHPDYSTGRPQKDIKFIRDVAHTSVFALCGYSGPFYSSERARIEQFPA